jgi:hypothetical protein
MTGRQRDGIHLFSRNDPHGGESRRLHRSKRRERRLARGILIGDGVPFFEKLDRDIALYLAEVKAFQS